MCSLRTVRRPLRLRNDVGGVKGLVIGSDNRASTSKLQASLWTVAVLFALTYLLFLGRSIGCGEGANRSASKCAAARSFDFDQTIAEPLQAEYFVLLGFPLAAALGAKALTTSKIAGGAVTKDKLPKEQEGTITQGLEEVVSNDHGEIDLLDFQYFAFNLLTLGFFFVEFLTDPGEGLPDLPTTLIALAGLSAATYTTKKALQTDEKPGITAVIPRRIPLAPDQVIVIRGSGFEKTPPPENPVDRRITLDGVVFPEGNVSWTPTRIEVTMFEDLIRTSRAKPDGTKPGFAAQSRSNSIAAHVPIDPVLAAPNSFGCSPTAIRTPSTSRSSSCVTS